MGSRNQAAIRATKPITEAAASQMNFRLVDAGDKDAASRLDVAKRLIPYAVPELQRSGSGKLLARGRSPTAGRSELPPIMASSVDMESGTILLPDGYGARR